MTLTIVETIEHQTQPTPTSCVATCIAMALGIPVVDLVAEIGTIRIDRAYGPEQFAVWLAERGVWMRPMISGAYGRGERLWNRSVYLVGVRSLNLVGSDHQLLLDTRGQQTNDNERSGWRVFDPNIGRDGVNGYDWVDESDAIDMHELRCRESFGGAIGRAP